jgi:3-deoxy-manno-octulosonate cytidylyltransferase (CMP-KDO synthetase)
LIKRIETEEVIRDPNRPKVVCDANNFALYFSRSPIPYLRNNKEGDWKDQHEYYQHIGMYAYRQDILKQITQLSVTELEKAESLEQLRWLENGYRIKTSITEHESFGIDTPQDLEKALKSGLV